MIKYFFGGLCGLFALWIMGLRPVNTFESLVLPKDTSFETSEASKKPNIIKSPSRDMEDNQKFVFPSDIQSGLIGVTATDPIDNPFDNVFHIQISAMPDSGYTAHLQYELFGVLDHSGIARSINDQQATGGRFINFNNKWSEQKERIALNCLKKGNNVIRFGLPENATFYYRIKNVSIILQKQTQANPEIVITSVPRLVDGKIYLKGIVDEHFFSKTGGTVTGIFFNDEPVQVFGNEFEIEKPARTDSTGQAHAALEAILKNGTRIKKTIVVSGTGSLDRTFNFKEKGVKTTAYFQPAAGLSINASQQHAGIKIPANSLKTTQPVSIVSLRDIDIPALTVDLVNVTKGAIAYRFLPGHLHLEQSAQVLLPYDSTMIPEGYTAADIKTYFFDEKNREWIELPLDSLLTEEPMIVSRTTQFKDLINGIIKVPESPQTQAYAPTSILGLKAGNASAGIEMIQPPSANQMGNASMQFPFKLPPGRQELHPEIVLRHTSQSGNTWVGENWNVSTPAVTIDTKYGVPRYSTNLETESYALNGDQLVPFTDKGQLIPRSAEKQFFRRVEGTFNKIIRHGTDPKNYWWEVTEKSGMRHYYGGTPAHGVELNAILLDDQDNIAEWRLVETRDLNENFVRYTYQTVNDAGIEGGTITGRQIYISLITYTGNGSVNGPYSVEFIRDRQLGETKRKDVDISGRLGFKMVSADLLRKIHIRYGSETIRSYELKYAEGAFYKTLLKSVQELDPTGTVFNSHEFDYYDDVNSQNGYTPYGNTENWSIGSDGLSGEIVNPIPGFTSEASALAASKSKNSSSSLALTLGIWNGRQDKSNTVGGSRGTSSSKSEGLVSLIDVDGNNLPDKIYKKNNGLFYRPNLGSALQSFGPARPLLGINDFSSGKTKTSSVGVEVNAFSAYWSRIRSNATNTINTYFADFNYDMLVDASVNGTVFFNRIVNGTSTYLPGSAQTPSPIFVGSNVSPQFLAPDTALQSQQVHDFPLHDAIRVWIAPFTGIISINAPVQLVNIGSINNPKKDGVRVSIQLSGSVLWSSIIPPNDFTIKNPVGLNDIAVTKGQRIYFRLQSIFNGEDDLVHWNPLIEYTNNIEPRYNADNRPTRRYQASEDFIFTNKGGTKLPKDGIIKIDGLFSKAVTSDSVRLLIIRDVNGVQSTLFEQVYPANSSINQQNITLTQIVLAGDHLLFKIVTDSHIDRAHVNWAPRYEYTFFNDGTPPLNSNGTPTIRNHSTPDNSNYNDWLKAVPPIQNTQADTISIKPYITGTAAATGSITFTVKRANQIIGKKIIQVQNGIMTNPVDSIYLERSSNDSFYCSFHSTSRTLALALTNTQLITRKDSTYVDLPGNLITVVVTDTINANLYTEPAEDYLGSLFRGWGHFAFKGDITNAPLDESRINTSSLIGYSNDPNAYTDSSLFNNIIDASTTDFIPLYANLEKQIWIGFDSSVYVSNTQMSSARLWMHDVVVDSLMLGGGIYSANKITTTKSTSYALGLSLLVGASRSYSTTSSSNELEMADINGDDIPDVVSRNRIQYSLASGGLEQGFITHNKNASTFSGESEGASLGGPLPTAVAKNFLSITSANVADNSSASSGISITANIGTNEDETAETWQDVNKDRLPDKVYKSGLVALNIGYSFLPPENWGAAEIEKNKSEERGAGLGINLVYGSFQLGYNLQRTTGKASVLFSEVTGDGAVDKVWISGNSTFVQINKGNGFGPLIPWNGLTGLRNTTSTGESFNAAYTRAIPIPLIFIVLKFCINPSASSGDGISNESIQLNDIDGDGYSDILYSENDGHLVAKRSRIGRTNMLKTVKRPMGSAFTIDYVRTGNTYAMPQSKWVLKTVEITDGVSGDGVDTMRTLFSYEGGYYDRNEREFLGFSKIETQHLNTAAGNIVYRTDVQEFLNTTVYNKGLLVRDWRQDNPGNRYTQTNNAYEIRAVRDSVNFPSLIKTEKLSYEGGATAISTRQEYDYSTIGNLIQINDAGDGSQQDISMTTISYHDNNARYIKSIPATIEVAVAAGIIRKRSTTINNRGDIIQIRQYLTNDSFAVYDMEHDALGNLTKLTRPANYKGQRMWYAYEYDNDVKTYVTKVSDAFGYTSSSTYNVMFGQVTGTLSMNNEPMRYGLDNRGRVTSITGPYEIAAGKPYTIAFSYHPDAPVPYALTRHYDQEHDADINTITFMDGLTRAIQVKKQSSIFKGKNLADDIMIIVSGRVIFDAFGRIITTHFPATEPVSPANITLSAGTGGGVLATNSFDVLDRTLTKTLADGSSATTAYTISGGFFSTKQTDALNNVKETLSDVKGQRRIVNVYGGPAGTITTRYQYNAIGEVLRVVDNNNNAIEYTYSKLGQQLSINHPDAGLTTFGYDLAGNMIRKITPQIQKEIPNGGAIKYLYDFERVSDIDYPRQFQNRVKYTYGKPGMGNRTGRLILQQDASGGQEFYYGKLGEITKTIRTVVVNNVLFATYISEQEFDAWNRIKKMVYADSEVVKYYYDRGGNLDSMNGYKLGNRYSYVKQLGYNHLEQKIYIQYGNGTDASYKYDSLRPRLQNLKASTVSGRLFMNNNYTYDAVDNVLDITNNIQAQPGLLGGFSKHTYRYDNLYRLTNAIGQYTGSQHSAGYNLSMSYDNLYNITRKQIVSSQPNSSYDNSYTYGPSRPHQAKQIGDLNHNYDQNGNLLSYGPRQNYWDEENRLMGVIENGILNQYTYDADGDRVVKSSGGIRGTWVNGAPAGFVRHDSNYTIYVDPYMVCRRAGFTKHYYVENQRISSRIGIGRFTNISFPQAPVTAGGIDYLKRLADIERQRMEYYRSQGISPGPPTDKFFYGRPENNGIPAPIIIDSTSNSIPAGWPGNTTPPVSGPPIFVNPIPSNDSVRAGYGFVGTGHFYEQNQYFYHPDHLGSTAYVTNVFGEVCQHQEYVAFGETFFEEHASSNQMPYLFNSKEKDENTNLYYYGARYFDPKTSMWISVDPLMDEQSQIEKSPYAYTWCNPVKYTDPDGRFLETAWDAFNVGVGVASLSYNLKNGNYRDAIIDGVGLAVDATATVVPFVPGGASTAIRAARGVNKAADVIKGIDKAKDVTKTAKSVAKQDEGVIYLVKGEKTPSGDPYIGQTDNLKDRTRNARDGRDRSGAEIIGTYPKGDKKAARIAEQKAINEHGGVNRLDNKRNEIKQKDWEKNGIKPPRD